MAVLDAAEKVRLAQERSTTAESRVLRLEVSNARVILELVCVTSASALPKQGQTNMLRSGMCRQAFSEQKYFLCMVACVLKCNSHWKKF